MELGSGLDSQIALITLSCLGIHLSYFFLIKTLFPSIGKDRRKLSWVLTLVTAIVVSFVGYFILGMYVRTIFSRPIPYEEYSHSPGVGFYRSDIAYTASAFQKLPAQEGFPHFVIQVNDTEGVQDQVSLAESRIAFYKAYDRAHAAKPWYHRTIFFDSRFQPGDSSVGQFFTLFFAMYLVADLALGTLYYPEKITIFAGWIHHIAYTLIAYYTVCVAKEGHVFSTYLMIEVPTVVIGLGIMNKRFRNDMVFGAAYIIFRLLFDFSLTHEYVFGRPDMTVPVKIILCSKSLLNIQFFADWIKQQIRIRKNIGQVVITTAPAKSPTLDVKAVSDLKPLTSCGRTIHRQDEAMYVSPRSVFAMKTFGTRGEGVIPGAKGVATTSSAPVTRSVEIGKPTTTRRRAPSTQSKRMKSKDSILVLKDYVVPNPVPVR